MNKLGNTYQELPKTWPGLAPRIRIKRGLQLAYQVIGHIGIEPIREIIGHLILTQ